MSEPRIPLLPIDEAVKAAEAIGISEYMAKLSIFRVLLRHPRVAKQIHDLLVALLFESKLDIRLRELLIMRIGWRTGSLYEWTQHWNVARRIGMGEAEILAVRDWRASPVLNEADRAVLAATDDTLDNGRISDATWELCREQIGGDAELAEMVVAIGNWRMFSEMLQSLQIPLEAGIAHWPPDGKAPPSADA